MSRTELIKKIVGLAIERNEATKYSTLKKWQAHSLDVKKTILDQDLKEAIEELNWLDFITFCNTGEFPQ
jgi:hypothetical protein